MTLLEVLLTLVLSSLFLGYTGQFIAIGTNIYTNIKNQQELRFAMNQVMRTFEEQYEEAAHLCIYIGKTKQRLKSLSGCENEIHGQSPLKEGDYTQYFLYYIDYYMPYEMYKDNHQNEPTEGKTRIELRENSKPWEEKTGPYFNIRFQTQDIIAHDLNIKVDVKEDYLILKIIIFKDEKHYLEDQLRLDLRYKL